MTSIKKSKITFIKGSLIGILAIILAVFWFGSYGPKYTYKVPEHTDDGWQTASLKEVGINEKILGKVIVRINDNKYQDIHSILIVKDEKLVFEEYFEGYTYDYSGDQFRGAYTEFGINTIHNLGSVTKAFTSALVGMASVFFQKSGSKNQRKKTQPFQDSRWPNGAIDMAITGG